jgi:hypothetical protein
LISPDNHHDGPRALADARRIEALASTKGWTHGLFSRRIYVLEGAFTTVERFKHEVPGLVQSDLVEWRDDHLTASAKEALQKIFDPPKPFGPVRLIKRKELNYIPVPTLITSMGRLSDATLLAIVAHRRPQVVLIYTPGDEWVAHMIKVYQDKAAELGLRRLLALPTDFTAANIHAHLPVGLAKYAEVNVTPGTRPQGVALGLWAKNHHVPAWAIDCDVIRRLDQPGHIIPVLGLSLKARLDFTLEAQVTDYGWGKNAPDWDSDYFYPQMLNFMALVNEKGMAERLFRGELRLEGYALTCLDRAANHWRFYWPADDKHPTGAYDLIGGYWYERLTAKAVDSLNRLGMATWDVSCGVEVSIPGQPRLLTERDVLAANSKAQLFMISCKTAGKFKVKVYQKILSEALAMAKTMGRFVIPVLCCMATTPPVMDGEVLVMGWNTLCHPLELNRALAMAAKALHG